MIIIMMTMIMQMHKNTSRAAFHCLFIFNSRKGGQLYRAKAPMWSIYHQNGSDASLWMETERKIMWTIPSQFSRVKVPCCFFWTSPKAGGLGSIRTLLTAKALAWFLVIVPRALIPHQAAGRTQLINNLRMEMGGTSSKAEFGWEGPCYFVMLLWNFRRFLFYSCMEISWTHFSLAFNSLSDIHPFLPQKSGSEKSPPKQWPSSIHCIMINFDKKNL